jgi:hypothetical protein
MNLATHFANNPYSIVLALSLGFLAASMLLAVRVVVRCGPRGGWWVLLLALGLVATQRIVLTLGQTYLLVYQKLEFSADLISLLV